MSSGLGIPDEEALNIYTDGSSFPHRKRNAGVGVCYVWVNDTGDEITEDFEPLGWRSATSDEMEIKACSVALKQAKRMFNDFTVFKKAIIFSDSIYVVNNYVNALKVWPNNGWRKVNRMPVDNIQLWKEFRKEVNAFPIRVDVEWVKGHKSNIYNRKADNIAKKSASAPYHKPLSRSDTTRKWSLNTTKRGCVPMEGQITKIRIVSREYINRAKTFEYRYEIIDPADRNFQLLDFVYCDTGLSRNKCYQVKFNDDQKTPYITEIISELECGYYKY